MVEGWEGYVLAHSRVQDRHMASAHTRLRSPEGWNGTALAHAMA